MITKKFAAVLIVATTLGYQCKDAAAGEKEQAETAIPAELKDTTVLNTDEDKALEQLKNVVGDSTQTK